MERGKWEKMLLRSINRFLAIFWWTLKKISTENSDPPQSRTNCILPYSTLDNIQNGLFFIDENGVQLTVINTCAFDALAQVYYSLGVDTEYFKNHFQNTSNDFYKYILDLIKNGANYKNNKIRKKLFLSFPSKKYLEKGVLTTVDVSCHIVDVIVHCVPRTVEIEFVCAKDKNVKRNQYYFIPVNVVNIKQGDLHNIQNIICLLETSCPECLGAAPGIKIYSIDGVALIDVQKANLQLYSIKINQIEQIINIADELLFLKGIIHYDLPWFVFRNKSMGHYRAFINRSNNLWELYDDLATHPVVVESDYKVNPAILIYAKRSN